MLGPVELVDEVDSTNRVLIDRARRGGAHGAVLVADHQTAGRGRLDRRWEAAPGTALLVSVLLRPRLAAERAFLITFAAGLAAVAACEDVAGVRSLLKWPNDLVVADDLATRKLAGLLAESVIEERTLAALVVGMGLNLRPSPRVPPGGATLEELAGRAVARDDLLGAWLEHLARRLDQLEDGGDRALLADYRQACTTLGRPVRVERPTGAVDGVALDVDAEGHLLVETASGVQTFAAGDVTHLRPGR